MARTAMILVTVALLGAACGNSSSSSGAGAQPCSTSGKTHVYVEVVNAGKVIASGCAATNATSLDALTVMSHSGVQYSTQKFSFGTAICQVDRIPAHYSKCLPTDQPYWADWIWKDGSWSMAQTGPEQIALSNKEALGWVYTPQTGSPAPPPPPPTF